MLLDKTQLKEMLKGRELKDVESLNTFLRELSKEVIETLMCGELTHFLGYEKHDVGAKQTANSRNGFSSKKVKSHWGPIQIETPRDRDGEFEPQLIGKRQRDLGGLEEKIISLYSKGMSTRDIQTHIEEIYHFEISPEMVSTVTNQVLQRAREWQSRPLERCYPIVFMDGLRVKMRVESRVAPVSVYLILGITLEGKKDCLGLWIGEEGESAKFWLTVLNEIKARGVEDVIIFSVDNLSGICQAIEMVFPDALIQKCIVHQIRSSLKHVSYKERLPVSKDLKEIYTALTETQALEAMDAFETKWGKTHKHIVSSWRNNWDELVTFFKFPPDLRKLIYTTNPIESFNRQLRKAIKTRSPFPNQDSVLKILFLTIDGMEKKWKNPIGQWSSIFPQLCIYFENRIQKYLQ